MAQSIPPDRSRTVLLLRPFQTFFRQEAAGGILLLLCAVVALIWANTPAAESYFRLWSTVATVGVGGFGISKPLLLWINDGLMAIFFFVVGLEIKREVLVGELTAPRQAALPIAGALGGMAVPALLYLAVTAGTEGAPGWGIPMATDIAFALGVMALLGRHAPLPLKIFLTALAIIDDLGAVLVIAFFYTAELYWTSLGLGLLCFAFLLLANRLGVHRMGVYAVLGIVLWVAFLKSGVHATIAGVLLALTIPARRRIDTPAFLERGRALLAAFAADVRPGQHEPTEDQRDAVHSLEVACESIESPLIRLEHGLHGWVAFFIMPVFALANAGVSLEGSGLSTLGEPVALGIILGLFLGKQIGVTAFAWAAVRAGIASLPAGISWRQIYGAACLCGIGFTMSLFIANLAFTAPVLLVHAKIGILSASVLSGIVGWLLLSRSRKVPEEAAALEEAYEEK